MTEEKQRACVCALAALAWADGEVLDAERSQFEEFARTWTSLPEKDVAAVLERTRTATSQVLNDLEQLSIRELVDVLGVGYAIVAADHSVTSAELNVLKAI